ncbi:hypothetical protein HanXRQr2_Chr03g0112511 [Helianthus annuus]|uniref:Uncharacterized protein n=1 Tax=Helianthus annuus TaxID=4232 RepID=A0A9K3JGI6_HELAN|nr:hypothetical protein HanXRQr2_Chr03g0112511 [Helianthus annuus]KAJ0943788.1 hypothetical protein HanPSC8_Chr03g0108811 [Helianthus annuus]
MCCFFLVHVPVRQPSHNPTFSLSPSPTGSRRRKTCKSAGGTRSRWNQWVFLSARITISFSWISQSFTRVLFHKESPSATTAL